jgi:uncharacterized damage-inducible protein DinB
MNSLATANLSCLHQGICMLTSLPDDIYSRPCADVFNSTIGGHMRHTLDHYSAFMQGLGGGRIDYDARERGTAIETDREAAIALSRRLAAFMESLGEADLERELFIRMDDGGDSSWSRTSLRRELQFLLSHTIHHYALIVSIATRYGVSDFPENFGIAPSTLHFHEILGG